MVKVTTPTANAKNDNVSIISSITGEVNANAVYVLAEGEILSQGNLKGYTSLIDMAWDINGEKKFDANYWSYVGGKELPTLSKK